MKYYEWLRTNHTLICDVDISSNNSFTVQSDMFPLPRSSQNSRRGQSQQSTLELALVGELHLSKVPLRQSTESAVLATLRCRQLDFRINREAQQQVNRLLPQSLEKFPLVGILGENQLFSRFWVLPSETLSQGMLIRILSLIQFSLPATLQCPAQTTESDTFGRYLAKYESPSSNMFQKRRTRYLSALGQQTQLRREEYRIEPLESATMQFDVNWNTVRLHTHTRVKVRGVEAINEQIQGVLRAKQQRSLNAQERRAVSEALNQSTRVQVEPWTPLNTLASNQRGTKYF